MRERQCGGYGDDSVVVTRLSVLMRMLCICVYICVYMCMYIFLHATELHSLLYV